MQSLTKLFGFLFLILNAYLVYSQNLTPICNSNGKWGYFDEKGNIVINYQYDYAGYYNEDLALVKKNKHFKIADTSNFLCDPEQYFIDPLFQLNKVMGSKEYGLPCLITVWDCEFIDRKGNTKIKVNGTNAYDFFEGTARIEYGFKYNYIDKSGNTISNWRKIPYLAIEDDGLESFTKYLSNIDGFIFTENYSTITETRERVHSVVFVESNYEFEEPVSYVWYSWIDETGKQISENKYTYTGNFSEGLAIAQDLGKFGYVDKNGKVVINFKFDNTTSFVFGKAIVTLNDEDFLIDTKGNIIGKPEYNYFYNLDKNTINAVAFRSLSPDGEVYSYSYYGFVNNTGNLFIPLKYDEAHNFSENLAAVKKDGLWGFIDISGKEIINYAFSEVADFKNGYAAVKNDYRWGFIDKTGKLIIDYKYEYAGNFNPDGKAIVINDVKGLINTENNIIIPFGKYGDIEYVAPDLYIIQLNDKYGLFYKDKVIAELEYDLITKRDDYLILLKERYYNFCDFSGNFILTEPTVKIEYFLNKKGIVKQNNKYNAINELSEEIFDNPVDEIYPASDKYWIITNKEADNIFYSRYFDFENKNFITEKYNTLTNFSENLSVFVKDSVCGYFTEDLKIAYRSTEYELDLFNDGVARITDKITRRQGLIDKNFKMLLKPDSLFYIRSFFDGIAAAKVCLDFDYVREDNLFYCDYIDKTGKQILRVPWCDIPDFSNGLARFLKDDLFGYIDIKGAEIISAQFNDAMPFSEGLASVCKKLENGQTKYGFIDKTGKIVIDFSFESAGEFKNGKALVNKNRRYYYIDKSGNELFE